MSRIKDDARDARGVTFVENVFRDVLHAFRSVRTQPLFAAVVVLTLALGMAANIAMFVILDRTQHRQPRYLIDPPSVRRLYRSQGGPDYSYVGDMTYDTYADFARWNRTLTALAGFAYSYQGCG